MGRARFSRVLIALAALGLATPASADNAPARLEAPQPETQQHVVDRRPRAPVAPHPAAPTPVIATPARPIPTRRLNRSTPAGAHPEPTVMPARLGATQPSARSATVPRFAQLAAPAQPGAPHAPQSAPPPSSPPRVTGRSALPPPDAEGVRNGAWLSHSVVYGVVPRNFGEHGARAVTARLDDLKKLGVDVLWLSPVYKTPPGDYGYAVTDYFSLRPDFGTKEEFKQLVDAAHARGMRVVLDFVPNHTSDQHPFFKDAQRRGPASPYYDFYQRDGEGKPVNYFDWKNLPNLNYDNKGVRRYVLSALMYWARRYKVDGFRLDAAWGIEQRFPRFWDETRRALRSVRPDIALVAEASARDPFYAQKKFNGAYDWTGELGHWAWDHVFDDKSQIVERLHSALTNDGQGYPTGMHVMRFLNNNDTGERFITKHGVEMTRAAAALLLTLPGVPVVFTGDEVGAEFRPYQDGAKVLPLADPHALRPYYEQLIRLRHDVPALSGDDWKPLPFSPDQRTYSYVRSTPGAPPALVSVNFGRAETISIELPPELRSVPLRDAWTGEKIAPAARSVELTMHAYGLRVLVPDAAAIQSLN